MTETKGVRPPRKSRGVPPIETPPTPPSTGGTGGVPPVAPPPSPRPPRKPRGVPVEGVAPPSIEHVEQARLDMAEAIPFGRRSGHALAVCNVCGMPSLLALVNSSGTRLGLKSSGWPNCLLAPHCSGKRVIGEGDAEGVPRVRPPTVARLGEGKRAKQRSSTAGSADSGRPEPIEA